jgi:hypothetical protein
MSVVRRSRGRNFVGVPYFTDLMAGSQIDTFVIRSLSPPQKTDLSDTMACISLMEWSNFAVRSTETK